MTRTNPDGRALTLSEMMAELPACHPAKHEHATLVAAVGRSSRQGGARAVNESTGSGRTITPFVYDYEKNRREQAEATVAEQAAEIERLTGLLERNEGRVKEMIDDALLARAEQAEARAERADALAEAAEKRLSNTERITVENALLRAEQAEARAAEAEAERDINADLLCETAGVRDRLRAERDDAIDVIERVREARGSTEMLPGSYEGMINMVEAIDRALDSAEPKQCARCADLEAVIERVRVVLEPYRNTTLDKHGLAWKMLHEIDRALASLDSAEVLQNVHSDTAPGVNAYERTLGTIPDAPCCPDSAEPTSEGDQNE